MRMEDTPPQTEEPIEASAQCPVDHAAWPTQKTARRVEPVDKTMACDEAGVWHVYGFHQARTVLRSAATKQAGFGAEVFEKYPASRNQGILYREGPPHHEQRRKTARFFTPKAVSTNYRPLMERVADEMVAGLQQEQHADVSEMSLKLTVQVIAQVVGLTNSRRKGMDRRLEEFFENRQLTDQRRLPALLETARFMWAQRRFLIFFLLDVRPAIQARRRTPQEDLISHLIAEGYTDQEMLIECITYAAAGMVTTREFISVALWHFLEQPELRERYLAAPEEERYEMLREVVRLEPVLGHLLRRATSDLPLAPGDDPSTVIPEGALIDIHIYATNADERVVGDHPRALVFGRKLSGEAISPALMSFGDGAHTCPGSYLAIQETDILLQRLLPIQGLRLDGQPKLGWNEVARGYEVRNFIVRTTA